MPAAETTLELPYDLTRATSAFLRADAPLFIGGEWLRPARCERIPVIDPATGLQVGTALAGGEEHVDAAVAAAREAFDKGPWPRMSAAARRAILNKLADLIEADARRIAEVEVLDNGMALAGALGMAAGAAELFRYYAGWIGKVAGENLSVDSWDPSAEVTAYTRREPLGVAGLILPWNFPFVIAAMKLAPALAAGCTVVLKPAEQTPLAALILGELAQQAGLPDGVLNIVNGHGEVVGARLAAHPQVDKISFTGSTEVGRAIIAAASGNMKKVSLELGGKAPFIVLPDADLEKAAQALIRAAFGNQGQNCTCASRILVHESVAAPFEERVVELIGAMAVGPGFEAGNDLGPLISAEHRDKVLSYVAVAKAEGAAVAIGGAALDRPGNFMEPTLITGARGNMRVMQEEIFGPVTCLQTFADLDVDAIAALANATDYGLVASVWTRDLATAHKLGARIKAGTVSINGHGHPGINAPFGGYKQSGWGREFGRAAMEGYLETKTVAVNA
ncbi:aldehyde dehydrogenase family protein [Novosphingobium sp. BL-52-GroH]|uniref:aldehyde dehydrogenase family protein n=1 Tax=Novosphingobium sp. BL-52-GroH TaxID=3349877 RepID=UPI00384E383B